MQYYCYRPEFHEQNRPKVPCNHKESATKPQVNSSFSRRTQSEPATGTGNDVYASESNCADGGSDMDGNVFNYAPPEENFDFYLSVAQEDFEQFGWPFCKMLESKMKMKACMTIRDIRLGKPLYEEMAHTLETRCNGKVVFVVSNSFIHSDECQFLVHFAKTLDPFALSAKLIPLVIDKQAEIPQVLQGLSCIHYNAAIREGWLCKRLWEAVNAKPSIAHRSYSSPGP